MQFNFSKKKKNFISSSGRYGLVPAYRSQAVSSRLAKNRAVSAKSILIKIFIALVFAGFGYLLFFSSIFKVREFIVSGNTTISADEVRQAAQDIAARKIYKLIDNNLILIKTEEIEKAIQEKFNSVESVSAVKKFPKKLVISIVEKPMDILWCNKISVEKVALSPKDADNNLAPAVSENISQDTSQCYFSDGANIVYRKATGKESESGVKVFKDDMIKIGDKISDDTVRSFVRSLAKTFNFKTGLEFSYLYLPPISSRELHLAAKDGWKIFFDLNRPAEDQLDVFNSVWRESIPESYKNSNNIEYIDLRVISRVSWKPKNEVVK